MLAPSPAWFLRATALVSTEIPVPCPTVTVTELPRAIAPPEPEVRPLPLVTVTLLFARDALGILASFKSLFVASRVIPDAVFTDR